LRSGTGELVPVPGAIGLHHELAHAHVGRFQRERIKAAMEQFGQQFEKVGGEFGEYLGETYYKMGELFLFASRLGENEARRARGLPSRWPYSAGEDQRFKTKAEIHAAAAGKDAGKARRFHSYDDPEIRPFWMMQLLNWRARGGAPEP
jgi:hypothetical protein